MGRKKKLLRIFRFLKETDSACSAFDSLFCFVKESLNEVICSDSIFIYREKWDKNQFVRRFSKYLV